MATRRQVSGSPMGVGQDNPLRTGGFNTRREPMASQASQPRTLTPKEEFEEMLARGELTRREPGVPSPTTPTEGPPTHQRPVLGGAAIDLFRGAGAGLASTVFHGGDLIRRAIGMERVIGTPEVQKFITPPDTKAGRIGFGAEQLAEFLTPLGVSSTLVKAIPAASRAQKAWKVARQVGNPTTARISDRLARVGATSVGEGVEFGAKSAIQTGDTEDVVTAALTGGLSPVATSAVIAGGRIATRVFPEKLYSQVFRSANKDWTKAYTQAAKEQKVDPLLAREVLDRGIWGSPKNMAVYTMKKLIEWESKMEPLLQGKTLKLPKHEGYIKLLDDLGETFGSTFSKVGVEATRLATILRRSRGGQIYAPDALALKRLIDGQRSSAAFHKSTTLSPRQDEYKEAADLVRTLLHKKFPTVSEALTEERVMIRAFNELVRGAVARDNQKLLGLTDYMLGGGGMASGYGMSGIGLAAGVRGFQQPFTLTALGQGLSRLNVLGSEQGTRLGGKAAAGALASGQNRWFGLRPDIPLMPSHDQTGTQGPAQMSQEELDALVESGKFTPRLRK
jgi:hypothetical protein